jgi:YidC/Oxa1 family membrane protein insertase
VFEPIVAAFHAFRDALYLVLKFYQQLVEPVLGSQSYWFSIVMLTLTVRIVLIPLTVKQVKASRAMSEIAPEVKKLQAKYKNDREKLNQEMMALYKERGANPLAGCLPIVAQAPFFFALYHVIYQPTIAGEPNILLGQTFFGIPLQIHWLRDIQPWTAKFFSWDGAVILLLIVAMAATTFISQRQLMSKQATAVNPQQQTLVKVMPIMFAVFAVNFPLAVIIYWVTTNLWSMGQQYILLRNRPPAPAPEPAAAGARALVDGRDSGDEPKGFMATLRSFIDPVGEEQARQENAKAKAKGGAKNGKQPRPAAQNKGQGRPESNGKQRGAQSGQNAQQGNRAKQVKPQQAKPTDASAAAGGSKGSTPGQKSASPPRPGGGKSGGRSQQQRRRKR